MVLGLLFVPVVIPKDVVGKQLRHHLAFKRLNRGIRLLWLWASSTRSQRRHPEPPSPRPDSKTLPWPNSVTKITCLTDKSVGFRHDTSETSSMTLE